MTSNDRMGSVGEEEHDPIKLKSIKTNKTFTVPQNDRVRKRYKNFPSAVKNLGRKTIKHLPFMVRSEILFRQRKQVAAILGTAVFIIINRTLKQVSRFCHLKFP